MDNVALLLAYLYLFLLAQAAAHLVLSTDGSIAAGWGGDPLGQVLGWAMFGGAILAIYAPSVVLVLVLYRVIVNALGHARLVAVVAASLAIVAMWLILRDVDASTRLVIGFVILGYGLIVRVPGNDFGSLPPWIAGTIVGLALSAVWLIGPALGIVYGLYRASGVASRTYGACVCVWSSLLPGLILFDDLFRPHDPGANYVVTAILLIGTIAGLVVLARHVRSRYPSHRHHRPGSRPVQRPT